MKTVQPWSEQSPPISLVWTSFRTPNCRLAWREHAGQIALPFDVLRRRKKEVNHWRTFFFCCAGLDLHKKSVEACVRRMEPSGHVHQQTRHWGTMTRDILMMADWMAAQGVTHVAMESTECTGSRLQHLGKPLHRVAGECPAPEAGSRTQERYPRLASGLRNLLQHGLLRQFCSAAPAT